MGKMIIEMVLPEGRNSQVCYDAVAPQKGHS